MSIMSFCLFVCLLQTNLRSVFVVVCKLEESKFAMKFGILNLPGITGNLISQHVEEFIIIRLIYFQL